MQFFARKLSNMVLKIRQKLSVLQGGNEYEMAQGVNSRELVLKIRDPANIVKSDFFVKFTPEHGENICVLDAVCFTDEEEEMAVLKASEDSFDPSKLQSSEAVVRPRCFDKRFQHQGIVM